ncbi:hypothetical protein ACLMJK_000830 [Lecanora helva]
MISISLKAVYLLIVLYLPSFQAKSMLRAESTIGDHNFVNSHSLRNPLASVPFDIHKSIFDRSRIDPIVHRRSVSVHNVDPDPNTATEEEIHVITLFKIDFVYTDKDRDLVMLLLRKLADVVAAGVLGIELEPRHNLYLQLGQLSLNLYALAEVLTLSIVTAVVNRLAEMATRGFMCFGTGEFVLSAGVRVLFAAGIRLQGLEDINDFVVQPLIGQET